MRKSLITLFFILIVFISSNALYLRLEPTIFGTHFQPNDVAVHNETLTIFICGVLSGDYYLNTNEYQVDINPLSTTGVIIITNHWQKIFSTILLIPDKDTPSDTLLTKIQIIDQDTTLILGTSNSPSLQATNFPNDTTIPLIPLTDSNEGTYSFILTVIASREDDDSIDIHFTKLENSTMDFSAEEKFYYVTAAYNETTTSALLFTPESDPEEIFSSALVNSVNLVNQSLVVVKEYSNDKTTLSFIDINNNNAQYPIISILYEDSKFSIVDILTTIEDDNIAIYFFGNYNAGANIHFPSGSTCNLTFVENNNDHVYLAKYVIDQSLRVIDCLSISDTSSRISPTAVSFDVSKKRITLLGNFQELAGARGDPILQFGSDDNCQKPSLSEENPTNFLVALDISTLECTEIGTFENVVTANGSSYPVIGTNVVFAGETPVIMFYNPSIMVENKELSLGIMYMILPLPPLGSQPVYLPPSAESSETSIGLIESSTSHPKHTVLSITSYEESSEDEVVIPWYSTLIVIFLLVGAVIGTVALYNVYTKYKKTKNNVETRKHRFSRVPINNNDDDDNI